MDKNSENSKHSKPGGWWSFFFLVLVFGLILTAFGVGIGVGVSIRIPFTESNLSVGGSLGKKEIVRFALPNYLQNRVASNNDFINHSNLLTIWLAEGIGMIVLGKQPEAPVIDLNINLRR